MSYHHKLFKPEERLLFMHHPKPVRRATYHLLLNRHHEANEAYIKRFNTELAKDPSLLDKLLDEKNVESLLKK